MGIDGIGKGGAPPPRAGENAAVATPTRARETDKAELPFDVNSRAETAQVTAAAKLDPASPLEQLRAGRIDVEKYVDLKVEEATAHLGGLGQNELGEIKSMLRAQVASDPALADLVTQAAGQAPKVPVE